VFIYKRSRHNTSDVVLYVISEPWFTV